MIQAMRYSEWSHTADAVHMILQMMGKVKLKRMPPQPEWNHALLYVTTNGFTTGLIPDGAHSFEILMNLADSTVQARCTTGRIDGFPLRGNHSIADYFAEFGKMLVSIGHPTHITKAPQEVANTTPFDEQKEAHGYDEAAARAYFDDCVFAHNALLSFASPIRSKKIMPSLFWGTFDMTTVIFSGLPKPFPGEGCIEKVAFDEQFVEFGFWPGDPVTDEPMFFVLPYPFLQKDLTGAPVSPKEAYYSPEKKEFFLPLRAVKDAADPVEAVRKFCEDAFRVVAKEEAWKDYEWFMTPLEC